MRFCAESGTPLILFRQTPCRARENLALLRCIRRHSRSSRFSTNREARMQSWLRRKPIDQLTEHEEGRRLIPTLSWPH